MNIPVELIYDTLRRCRSIPDAAIELGCSRGYIYQVCKDQGTMPMKIIDEKIHETKKVIEA